MDYTEITNTNQNTQTRTHTHSHRNGANANNNYINKWKECKEINFGIFETAHALPIFKTDNNNKQNTNKLQIVKAQKQQQKQHQNYWETKRERENEREKGIAAVWQLRTMVQVQRGCSARRRQQQGDECKDAHSPFPHHSPLHLPSPSRLLPPSVVSSYCIDKYSKWALEWLES